MLPVLLGLLLSPIAVLAVRQPPTPPGAGGRRNYGPPYNHFGQSDSGLGAPCDYDEDCYAMEHTFCRMQQSCQCKIGFAPSPAGDRCLATIGAKCTTKYDCASLGPAGDCIQNVCDCMPGYLPGPENTCLKGAMKLSDACQEDIQCQNMEHATCANGRCQCHMGHHAVGNSNKCAATRTLHEPCDSDDQCHIGSEYRGVVNCYMGTCRCRMNYFETRDGKCSGAGRISVAIGLTIVTSLMVIGII